MSEGSARERRIAAAALRTLARYGVAGVPATMILFCMAAEGMRYHEALAEWAAFKATYSECRWHSEVCYALLKAGIEERAADWFAARVREVKEIENGISA